MWCYRALAVILALAAHGRGGEAIGTIPQFPEQFSARLEITSHMVDRANEYPPWLREMDVWYDHTSQNVKIVVKDGSNINKTYLRLYGSKKEYVIRKGEYPSCRRSYLGETMPLPELPHTAYFQGVENLEGFPCEHWLQDDDTSRIHIYVDSDSQVPRRLTEETVDSSTAVVLLVTYDFRDLKVGPQAPDVFVLPEKYASQEACDLHVGGFPYMHLFHHYLRV